MALIPELGAATPIRTQSQLREYISTFEKKTMVVTNYLHGGQAGLELETQNARKSASRAPIDRHAKERLQESDDGPGLSPTKE